MGVVDQSRTSRDAVSRSVAAAEGFGVALAVAHAEGLLAAGVDVDAVLFHVTLPVPDLVAQIQRLGATVGAVPILVVASYVDDQVEERLCAQGATLVLSTELGLDEILAAVAIAVQTPRSTASTPSSPQEPSEPRITDRELDVLRSLSEGRSPQQIAHDAEISLSTVRDHLKSLRRKLDCSSAVELVVTAHRMGLLPNLSRPLP